MTEPCDLTAVEARRLIGRKQLAPSELLTSCIARIEAVDHAVNAMVARDFERARATARQADEAVARGDDLPPLHGLPIGIKDLQETAGLRTTYGSVIFRDHVPAADERMVARGCARPAPSSSARPTRRSSAPVRTPATRSTARPAIRSTRRRSCGRLVRRIGGGAGDRHGAAVHRLGHRRLAAQPGGVLRHRRLPSDAGPGRQRAARARLEQSARSPGPMARTVPDLCLLLSAMVSDDARDPLATTVPARGARRRGLRRAGARSTCRGCAWRSRRISALPRPSGISPRYSREKTGLFRACVRPRRGRDARLRRCGRGVRGAACARLPRGARGEGAHPAAGCRPERARERRGGAALHRRGRGAGAGTADRAVPPLAGVLRQHWDVILTPVDHHQPALVARAVSGRDRRQADPHLLPLAGAGLCGDLGGHPAVSLPVGLDRNGMPFGLQIVGPRGGDAFVLGVAAELEAMLAGDARTARPVPDIGGAAGGAADQRDDGLPGVRLTTTGQRITAWRRCRSRASRHHPGAPRTIR